MLSSYDSFIRRKRWKSQGAKSGWMMVGDQTLPIENASGASFLQLQYTAEHCHEGGQDPRTTVLVACSERHRIRARTPHLAGDSIVLGMFTGSLCAQNWQVRFVVIGRHTRDIAQHICAKHLIVTLVLISRPIGPWEKKKKIALAGITLSLRYEESFKYGTSVIYDIVV